MTADDATLPKHQASTSLRSARTLAARGGATVLFLALLLTPVLAPAQQPGGPGVIIGSPKSKQPLPTNICVVDALTSEAWIKGVQYLKEVKRNIDDFVDKNLQVDASSFYTDPNDKTKGRTYRGEMQTQLKAMQGTLKKLSDDYSSKSQPACDTCHLFRAWWELTNVALTETGNFSSTAPAVLVKHQWNTTSLTRTALATPSIDIKLLTRQQVDYQGGTLKAVGQAAPRQLYGVKQMVDIYHDLASKKPPDDPNADSAVCNANMFPSSGTTARSTKQCNVDMWRINMDWVVGEIINSLEEAKKGGASDTMMALLTNSKGGYDTSCPKPVFPDNFLLGRFER